MAHTINELMSSPDWHNTAIVINYDDSDGWYDNAFSGVTNPSLSAADNLTSTTLSGATSQHCGQNPQTSAPLGGEQARCGFGPRLPLLVISPFASHDGVDHNLSSQSSAINFVEYNWHLPAIAASFDQALANTDREEHIPFDLAGMFQFEPSEENSRLMLDPATGEPLKR